MDDVGEAAQHKFNRHYLARLKSLSKHFTSRNLTSDPISAFRNEKANIMEAFKNCLHDKSNVDEKAFGIDVANSTEVFRFFGQSFISARRMHQTVPKMPRHRRDIR